jgi:hypothetical protein
MLAPETEAAFKSFGKAAFANGALPAKFKQIVTVAAHVNPVPLLH